MNIKFKVYSSNKEYREDFKAKMGSLKDKFFNIFKKAVPFEPIHDIEQFISSFLCDSDTKIDTHEMQENIRHYKSLEMESEKISERISFLEDIGIKFENYRVEKEKLLVQQYLLDRAEVHQSEEDIADLEQKIAIKKKEHIKLLGLIEKQRLELEELDKKIETLNKEYYGSDLKKELDNLKSQLELAKGRLDAINISINRLYSMLHNVATTWKIGCGLRNDEQVDFPDELLALEDNLIAGIKYILSYKKENIVEISTDGIDNFKEQMNGYKSKIGEYRADKSNSKKALEGEINKLELEIANLKMGIKSYPDKVTTLKSILTNELSRKYSNEVKVELVCDLIEIKDKKWRNAIEGYLHTQKFYLIVKPEYFIDALRIYDIYKNENNIYDVGIIDVEKVIQSRKPAQAGSLADEIMTDNEYVRAYMDFILGNVMKAESVEQLRNYKTAITETCMLYNNFVARQLDPKRWDIPYIGQQAIKQQLEIKEDDCIRKKEQMHEYIKLIDVLEKIASLDTFSKSDISQMGEWISRGKELSGAIEELDGLNKKLLNMDLTYLQLKKKELDSVLDYRKSLSDQLMAHSNKAGSMNEEIETLQNEKMLDLFEANLSKQQIIDVKINRGEYKEDWINEIGEERYFKELQARSKPKNIIDAFNSQVARTLSQKDKKYEELKEVRREYNTKYIMSHDIDSESNSVYDKELAYLSDAELTQYKEKIKTAKDQAERQFQEDFISRLRHNIETVTEQIRELDSSLKGIKFGQRSYRFEVKPRQSKRKYYDMIMDQYLIEGYSLFTSDFLNRHGDAVDELFSTIIDIDDLANSDQRSQLEKNIDEYTDYRTYLNFDLVETRDNGFETKLSRMIGVKSGGETQIPFYVSVLASFMQEYRVNQKREENKNTLRLVVFDEAFSKMDNETVEECTKFLHSTGLQVLICAPTDKLLTIYPHVDRTIAAIMLDKRTYFRSFDLKNESKETIDELKRIGNSEPAIR